MDETPEELEEIRREAETIDPQKYRRRRRRVMTVVAMVAFAGVAWLAIHMAEASRNPCERVRNHLCLKAPVDVAKCNAYQVIFKESVEDSSSRMRGVIRDQCVTKINRLREEDGIVVE